MNPQTLTWDAQNRLIQVSQRDSNHNGYDWTAVYDGLGRRISTTNQPVVSNQPSGSTTTTASIYDPQVEFLEIGLSINGAKAWLVRGPDANGVFGGMQGTGGLEAVVMDAGGAATGVINDYFGNGVATISGGTVTWNTTHVGGYGPLPDSAAQPLTSITQLASAVSWRGHYIDPTGFYNLGARYYEPTSGRFLSVDPLGFAGSTSLYDFGGDPVNHFDADGRCAEQGGDWWNPSIMGDSNFNFATGATGQSWITNWGQTADTPASNTTDPNNAALPANVSRTGYTVLLVNEPADLPGGSIASAMGINHQFLAVYQDGQLLGAAGLGDRAGPPGASPDSPYFTTAYVDDHTSRLSDPNITTQPVSGVDPQAVLSYVNLDQVNHNAGPWVLGSNDCNTWCSYVIKNSTPTSIEMPQFSAAGSTPMPVYQQVVIPADGVIRPPANVTKPGGQ